MAASSPAISVRCREATLLQPAEATPYELKPVSDIDDQEGLRFELPLVFYYQRSPAMAGQDMAAVARDTISKTLVFYHPFAGRMRESQGGKLVVECTGEGVVFVEADADVSLADLGDPMLLPPPVASEFVQEVEGSGWVVDCPLLKFQVTRLSCVGFVVGVRFNHVMTDAGGVFLFMAALADISRGDAAPSITPVWDRHLLSARSPPRITHPHPEYSDPTEDADADVAVSVPLFDDMVHRVFTFGPREISALRSHLPPHLRLSSAFEILSACVWRSRTLAAEASASETVRLFCVANGRARFNPALPAGYYGNLLGFPAAATTAGKLTGNPLGYAVELVRRTKRAVTEEYMRSVADLMAAKRRPQLKLAGGFMVSDVTQFQAQKDVVEFAWGKLVYGGPGTGGPAPVAGFSSFFLKGEGGTVVPVCLPGAAMERFVAEIEGMTTERPGVGYEESLMLSKM